MSQIQNNTSRPCRSCGSNLGPYDESMHSECEQLEPSEGAK